MAALAGIKIMLIAGSIDMVASINRTEVDITGFSRV
jgi:hypothetical protein